MEIEGAVKLVAELSEGRGTYFLVMDLREVTDWTDFFVIWVGESNVERKSFFEDVLLELKRAGFKPLSVEADGEYEWCVLDYGDFVIHVFSPEKHDYYALEKLWFDGIKIIERKLGQ